MSSEALVEPLVLTVTLFYLPGLTEQNPAN